MSDWQQMKTAPKDGRQILVWSSGNGQWPRIARWCDSLTPGWWGLDHAELGVPTHWMPMPYPPPLPGSGPVHREEEKKK